MDEAMNNVLSVVAARMEGLVIYAGKKILFSLVPLQFL
jgi:hypothetical protein